MVSKPPRVPLPPSDDDGEGFIERFRRGDAAAWECAAGWATAAIRQRTFGIRREDVEDLTWKAIEEVWVYVNDGKQVRQARAFICHVARCRALSYWRQKRDQIDLSESLPDPGLDPCMQAVLADERMLMRALLQQLGPAERKLVQLRMEGWSYSEIAARMGRTENYWKSQMCELVAKLRRQMKLRPPTKH